MANLGNGICAYFNNPGVVTFASNAPNVKAWRTTNNNNPPSFTSLTIPTTEGNHPVIVNKSNLTAVQISSTSGRLYFLAQAGGIGYWNYNVTPTALTSVSLGVISGATDVNPSTSFAALAVPSGDAITHYLFWQGANFNLYWIAQDPTSGQWSNPDIVSPMTALSTISAASISSNPAVWVLPSTGADIQCFHQTSGGSIFLPLGTYLLPKSTYSSMYGPFSACGLGTSAANPGLFLQKSQMDQEKPLKIGYFTFASGNWTESSAFPSTQPVSGSSFAAVGSPGANVTIFYQSSATTVSAKMTLGTDSSWSDAVTLP